MYEGGQTVAAIIVEIDRRDERRPDAAGRLPAGRLRDL